MFDAVKSRPGFIGALDQSGGSTPKALRLYGIEESQYSATPQMFDIARVPEPDHRQPQLRRRPRARRDPLREDHGPRGRGRGHGPVPVERKHVVPFLKVDKGLADEADGVQIMKPIRASTSCSTGRWARACSARRCARSSSSPTAAAWRARRPAVRGRPPDPRPRPGTDHRARGRHQAARRRRRPRTCSRPRSWSSSTRSPTASGHAEAHAARTDGFYPDCIDHPRCSGSSPCPAGTPARRRTPGSPRNPD